MQVDTRIMKKGIMQVDTKHDECQLKRLYEKSHLSQKLLHFYFRNVLVTKTTSVTHTKVNNYKNTKQANSFYNNLPHGVWIRKDSSLYNIGRLIQSLCSSIQLLNNIFEQLTKIKSLDNRWNKRNSNITIIILFNFFIALNHFLLNFEMPGKNDEK